MRCKPVLTAILAIAALSGCTVGPSFERPIPPATPGYGMSGDDPARDVAVGAAASPAGPWWTTFDSADLDRTMDQALAGNQTLAAADATLAQARAALVQVRAASYPTIGANAGAEQERLNLSSFGFTGFPGLSNNPEFSLYSVGLTASYALDIFGGQRRTVEEQKARYETTRQQGAAATLALTGDVATQAATIAALRAQIATVEAILADDRQNLALVRSAEAVGGQAQGARVSATSQLALDEAALPPLRQDLAAARHALAILVGKAPADWTAPDFDLAQFKTPAAVPVSLPSELVRKRPDILAAEARLHAATADIGVATARLYPSLNLTGALTQSSLQPGQIFDTASTAYTLAAGLTAPLFDGGRLNAIRRQTVQARRVAFANYQETVLQAFGQIATLLQALAHDEDTIAAQTRAAEAAASNLRLARAGFQAGGYGLLPVVDAQRTYNIARRRLTDAEAQKFLDIIQLYVATAADWTKA